MPTSSAMGKDHTIDWVTRNRDSIKNVLDIGCGEGTYPKLLKETNPLLNDCNWWGVEAWTPYISEFNLHSLYDNVLNEDIRFIDWQSLPNFDLVICGDVLEHMTKEESQEVVKRALEKTKFLIISIPIVKAKQGSVNGNKFEIHVKPDWSHNEVLESFDGIVESQTTKRIGVYFLESSVLK